MFHKLCKVILCVCIYVAISLLFASIYVHRDMLPIPAPESMALLLSISVWALALVGSFFATNWLRCERTDPDSDRVAVRLAFIAYVVGSLYYFI